MKVNYLSIVGSKLQFIDWLPYKIALEQNGPNSHMLKYLEQTKSAMMGITVMDFPGNKLIEKIISQNFD